jgi:hypothetical protein
MSDASATFYLSAAVLCAVLVVGAIQVFAAWRRLRGARLVTCPETRAPAAVALAGSRVAINAMFHGRALRLSTCSRWPERRRCDQACVSQIEAAPEDTLVRDIVGRWIAGKTCVYCHHGIAETRFVAHHPALIGDDGQSVEWTDVPAERLPALFDTHRPVCWNCHVIETFRRTYPELVTDRSPAALR